MPTPRRPAPRPSPPARPTLRAQAEALLQNYLAGFFSFTGVLTGQEDRIDAMLEEACRILAPDTSARFERLLAKLPDAAQREEVTALTTAYMLAGAEAGYQTGLLSADFLQAHGLKLPASSPACAGEAPLRRTPPAMAPNTSDGSRVPTGR